MRSGAKACWRTILLETPATGAGAELSRPERLAALYRFQNGEAPAELRLVEPHGRAIVTDPADVDWTHFPVVDALEAITRDELSRLRSLLRADATPITVGQDVWGVDARNPAVHNDGVSDA